MANVALQKAEAVSANHPRCPVCAVAMWLVKIEKHYSCDASRERHHFKCMACDAEAILPPMDD
jgi:hypothetical protein